MLKAKKLAKAKMNEMGLGTDKLQMDRREQPESEENDEVSFKFKLISSELIVHIQLKILATLIVFFNILLNMISPRNDPFFCSKKTQVLM